MIERIEDMPPGTIGLRGTGKLTRADYAEMLEPALREAVESGEVRMLFVLSDFDGLEPGAVTEDIRTGLTLGAAHRSAWKRLALVTDVEWVRKAMGTFAWVIPGDSRAYDLDELEQAKEWVAS
jgi:hypothetical protein